MASSGEGDANANANAASKLSLLHILDDGDASGASAARGVRRTAAGVTGSSAEQQQANGGGGRRRAMTAEEKRKARTCVVDGCPNYIVHRKRCFRHGGGKTCSVEGCNTSAKQRGLCWRHGGSILCSIEGCKRGVKSRGLCWTHGGGAKKQKTSNSGSEDNDNENGDGGSSTDSTDAIEAAAALAVSLRRAPHPPYSASVRERSLSPLPPHVLVKAEQTVLRPPPSSPALGALSRYCLFDDCRARPTSLNGYSSAGFCAFHARQVTQKDYVFEL